MSSWTEDEGSRGIVSRRGSRLEEGSRVMVSVTVGRLFEGLSVVVCAVEVAEADAVGGGGGNEGACGGGAGRFLGGPGFGSRWVVRRSSPLPVFGGLLAGGSAGWGG